MGRDSAKPSCLCGSTMYRRVWRGREKHKVPGQKKTYIHFEVHVCRQCGLARILPPPTLREVANPEYQDVRNQIRTMSYNAEDQMRGQAKDLEIIGRFKKSGKLLDVGCQLGVFLNAARRHGYDVQGIEISHQAAEFARQLYHLPVYEGLLETAPFAPESFDVIVLSHVIEHLGNPDPLLKTIQRFTQPDGILYVSCPNFASPIRRWEGSRWGFRPLEHIWYYSPETIRRVLEQSGWKVLLVTAEYNMNHDYVYSRGMMGPVKKFLYERWAREGQGDNLMAVAAKKVKT